MQVNLQKWGPGLKGEPGFLVSIRKFTCCYVDFRKANERKPLLEH